MSDVLAGLADWIARTRGGAAGARPSVVAPPAVAEGDPRGHGDRIRNAFGQSLADTASMPLPAAHLRGAILDGLVSQFLASPTNVGEAEYLRKMKGFD